MRVSVEQVVIGDVVRFINKQGEVSLYTVSEKTYVSSATVQIKTQEGKTLVFGKSQKVYLETMPTRALRRTPEVS